MITVLGFLGLAVFFAAVFLGLAWSVGLHRSRSKTRTRAYFAIQSIFFGMIVVLTGPEIVFLILGILMITAFGAAIALLVVMTLRARHQSTDMSFERVMAANIVLSPIIFTVAALLRAFIY